MSRYQFTSPSQIEQNRKMAEQLRGQKINNFGRNTISTGSGLAHMLRQWAAGKATHKADAQEKENTALQTSEMQRMLIEGNRGISQGEGPLKPEIQAQTPDQPYTHPDVLALALQGKIKANEAAAQHGRDIDLQGVKDAAALNRINQQGANAQALEEKGWNAPYTLGPLQQRYQPGTDGAIATNPNYRPPSSTNVNTGDRYMSRQIAETVSGSYDDAMSAVKEIKSGHEARRLIEEGIRTGTLVNFRQDVGRLLNSMGITYDSDPTANTDAYGAAAAARTAQIIKNFGAGTGLSDADRNYAESAAAGKIEMNEEALLKILDINDRASRRLIEVHGEMLGRLGPDDPGRNFYQVTAPDDYIDQKTWDLLTPEEQALWDKK